MKGRGGGIKPPLPWKSSVKIELKPCFLKNGELT